MAARYSDDFGDMPPWMETQGIAIGEMDPTAPRPKPTANAASNYQWNADNVFKSWDLNPLAMEVGAGADGVRDTLAEKRDAFLKPYYANYRATVGEGASADDDYGLFNSADFQTYVKTGQTSKAAGPQATPQTVAQQWTSQQQAQNQDRNTALYDALAKRASQSLTVDRNDPTIRAQADAYSANQERARRNYISDSAEQAGPLANIQGERRMAAERSGQNAATFEAGLMGQELTARRQEISQALESMRGLLTSDQQNALQQQLALIDAQIRQQGLNVQQQGQQIDWNKALLSNDQFMADLGLRAEDRASYYDLVRRGLL